MAGGHDGERTYVRVFGGRGTSVPGVAALDIAGRNHVGGLGRRKPLVHPNGRRGVGPLRVEPSASAIRAFDVSTGKGAPEFRSYTRKPVDGRPSEAEAARVNAGCYTAPPEGIDGVFALSPRDGRLLAYHGGVTGVGNYGRAGDRQIVPADPTGQPIARLADEDDPLGPARQIHLTPDGRRLVGISHPEFGPLEMDRPDVARVWRASDGQVLVRAKVPAGVTPVALSPGGHWVALACRQGQVRVLSTATGAEVLVLDGPSEPVFSVEFSPGGGYLACGGDGGMPRVGQAG